MSKIKKIRRGNERQSRKNKNPKNGKKKGMRLGTKPHLEGISGCERCEARQREGSGEGIFNRKEKSMR